MTVENQIAELHTTIQNTKFLMERWEQEKREPEIWSKAVALKQQYGLTLIAAVLDDLAQRLRHLETR